MGRFQVAVEQRVVVDGAFGFVGKTATPTPGSRRTERSNVRAG
jgi:hypothetical protein